MRKQTPLFQKDNLGNLSYTNKVSALAVNMLIGGIVSKASGGNFEQGAVTAAVVFLYNSVEGMEGVPCAMGGNACNHMPKGVKRVIQGAGGVAQVVSGAEMIGAPGQNIVTGASGALLITHGVNNIQEAWTGKSGYLKSVYQDALGEKYGDLAYTTVDLMLSVKGLTSVKVYEGEEFIQGFGNVYYYNKTYGWEEMSKYSVGLELMNDMYNFNSIYYDLK